ncbi:MAG: hypothetical protein WC071_11955 [Victivallaceae bacterium]
MSKKKHLRSRPFTLIEIMMAMSIFLILSLIMMRFFSSSQRIFSLTSQRNMLYADARIAMDLIARDLQGAMYNNDNSSKGIYPFWFQKINDVGAPYYDSAYPITWTSLNFIASTNLKPDGANSNVCELRYTAVPAGETFTNADGIDILDGWLIRSCTADNASPADMYNFASNPRNMSVYQAARLNRIWIDKNATTNTPPTPTVADSSFENFVQVIPNVYELKFTCYCYYPNNAYDANTTYATGDWVASGTKLYMSIKDDNINHSPPNSTYWQEVSEYSSSTSYNNGALVSWSGKVYRSMSDSNSNQPDTTSDWQIEMCKFAPSPNSDAIGSNFPVVVKIDLSLLSDTDWFQWKNAVKEGNGNTLPAERILRHKLRTFSKAVYIPTSETY